MKLEDILNRDEAVRLEALRLAIAAGTPLRAPDFFAFIMAGDAIKPNSSGLIAQGCADVT